MRPALRVRQGRYGGASVFDGTARLGQGDATAPCGAQQSAIFVTFEKHALPTSPGQTCTDGLRVGSCVRGASMEVDSTPSHPSPHAAARINEEMYSSRPHPARMYGTAHQARIGWTPLELRRPCLGFGGRHRFRRTLKDVRLPMVPRLLPQTLQKSRIAHELRSSNFTERLRPVHSCGRPNARLREIFEDLLIDQSELTASDRPV